MAEQSTFLTQLWTLTSPGGDVLRLTTNTSPVPFGGQTFAPVVFQPSKWDERDDLSPNQMEVTAFIDDALVTERRLIAGKWNRALVHIRHVDWTNPVASVRDWKGILRAASVTNGLINRFEFVSRASVWAQLVGDIYSPTCRVVEYGDAQCGRDITAETFARNVAAVTDRSTVTLDGAAQPDGYFNFGTCLFTSGNNQLIKLEVKTSVGNALTFVEEFPFDITAGDDVTVVRGCDREFATCVARANALRFRGEQNIPGVYKLLKRFPE